MLRLFIFLSVLYGTYTNPFLLRLLWLKKQQQSLTSADAFVRLSALQVKKKAATLSCNSLFQALFCINKKVADCCVHIIAAYILDLEESVKNVENSYPDTSEKAVVTDTAAS